MKESVALRIWHIGASRDSQTVNGANQAIWALARAQALAGHDVSVIVSRSALASHEHGGGVVVRTADDDSAFATIELRSCAQAAVRLRSGRPDVLHMHSVYSPAQALLALIAQSRGVPYVVTPHGGYMPSILARHGGLKRMYRSTIERWRLRNASAAIAVAAPEVADIRRFSGLPGLRVEIVPNIVEAHASAPPRDPAESDDTFDAIYLGRLEVPWKGIDRIIEIAGLLPHRKFGLFGADHPSMSTLKLPENVAVLSPVYGDEKSMVLAGSGVLLQLSRWEVFGMSVVEALLMGTQVMVSDEMYLAPWVERIGGLIYRDADSASAAEELEKYLSQGSNASDDEARRSAAARYIDTAAITSSLDSLYRDLRADR